ncbi:carboxyl-terminal-processing peptidase 2, chloroplastic-like isoform X2 [Nymphaea colorata]|uniref:carboxyl-terminal-processing peptidase 2, chloroplastic-like isoform X2 n=1 Tax=Nymphaea colorata TaxID=210225 RepID=UPI00129E13B4|nr:carboxyl-terminal-processing peptidase 2, chloroplastic-like isoform X2 [Nymphaea colorata]
MATVHSLSVWSLIDAPSYHPCACLHRPLSLKKTQAFQSMRIRKTCHEWSHFLCLSSDRASRWKTAELIMYTKKSLVNSSMFQYLKKIQRTLLMYCKPSFYHHILKFQERVAGFPELKRWKNFRYHMHYLMVRSFVGVLIILSVSVAVSNNPSYAVTEENLLFLEAWRTIDRAYYDKTFNGTGWFRYREKALREEPMNTREETYTAIKKMIRELDDPFTRFLEPEKFKSLRSGTQGALTGVGLSIGYPKETKEPSTGLVVISATPGGPANRAGILPGDIILAIDNKSTTSMGLYDAADHLQGPEGSLVELTIRSSPSEEKNISLKREKVKFSPVTSRMCEVSSLGKERKKIGYIKLTSFNQNASGAVKDAIESLRKNNVDAFVLDLRNNSGGLFPEGIEVAKIWMQKGVIVYICDSRGVRDMYEADANNAIATSEPLAVLVNRGTASASEILAGALKDNNRAVLYGEPTFGKGKIQSVFELSDGSGLAVTVARYETPSHIDIDKVGVIPDHPLPATFPLDEDQVCSCIDATTSSCSLDRAKLFSK